MKLLELYRSGLKIKGTEEKIDTYVYRPLGFGVALVAQLFHLTPNQMTFLSGFLGISSGILFYNGYLGVSLIIANIALIFDCSDGQLARLTQNYSFFGRVLDGVVDYLFLTSLFLGMTFYYMGLQIEMSHRVLIFFLGVVSGISLAVQAASLDYYRYLYMAQHFKNQKSIEEEMIHLQNTIKSEYLFYQKWALQLYRIYSKKQETFEAKRLQPLTLKSVSSRVIYGTSTHIFLLSIAVLCNKILWYVFLSTVVFNGYALLLKIKRI